MPRGQSDEAEGPSSAKAGRLKCTWCVPEIARRPMRLECSRGLTRRGFSDGLDVGVRGRRSIHDTKISDLSHRKDVTNSDREERVSRWWRVRAENGLSWHCSQTCRWRHQVCYWIDGSGVQENLWLRLWAECCGE